jgi:hypothetical protein
MSDKKISAAAGIAMAMALGCSAGVKQTVAGIAGASGTDAGADRPIIMSGTAGTGGQPIPTGFAGAIGTGGAGGTEQCTPSVTCMPAGGRYCNTIGNGCKGGMLECGTCPGDATCSGGAMAPGICIGGPSCTPLTCQSGGAVKYCDKIGDGCGRELDCGACGAGQTCRGGLCVPAACTPLALKIYCGGKY